MNEAGMLKKFIERSIEEQFSQSKLEVYDPSKLQDMYAGTSEVSEKLLLLKAGLVLAGFVLVLTTQFNNKGNETTTQPAVVPVTVEKTAPLQPSVP